VGHNALRAYPLTALLVSLHRGARAFSSSSSTTRPLLRPHPRRRRRRRRRRRSPPRRRRRRRCAPRLVMESTRDIVARIYGEYQGSASCLYYADDSAIWAIHCVRESFKSLYKRLVRTYMRVTARDMLLYRVLKASTRTVTRRVAREKKKERKEERIAALITGNAMLLHFVWIPSENSR